MKKCFGLRPSNFVNSNFFFTVLAAATLQLGAIDPIFAQSWTLHRLPAAQQNLIFNAVTCSADGNQIVAAGGGSTFAGTILISSDFGNTWRVTSAPAVYWLSVASSADGKRLVAGGSDTNSGLYVSSDSGTNWTAGIPAPCYGVACSSNGLKMVAVKYAGNGPYAGSIYLSTDGGSTWNPSPSPATTNSFSAVASSADGDKLVAVGGLFNKTYLYTSGDGGQSWVQAPAPSDYWMAVACSADGNRMVALGISPNRVYTSLDAGATWALQAAAPPEEWGSVASSYNGRRLVAAGAFAFGQIYTSTDGGVSWFATNNAPLNPTGTHRPVGWEGVASSADGLRLVGAPAGGQGIYTLEFAPLSAALTATPSRVDLNDTIEVAVTIQNSTTNTLTNVQVDGSITVNGSGGVAFSGFSGPSVLLTLPPGTNATLTYLYEATNYGIVEFSASVKGQQSGGAIYSPLATSGKVAIFPKCDLMVKTTAKNDTNFLGAGEFQQVPYNDQSLRLGVGTNGVAGYVLRVENASRIAHTFVLIGATNSAYPNWKIQVLANNVDILSALTSTDGWTTPSLDPGAYVDLRVSLSPMANAGLLDLQSVLIGALPDSVNKYVLDAVLLRAQLVPVPVQISLYALNANGLTADSIQAGLTDINAPLVPVSDPQILAAQQLIHGGLVADGVTPLLIELSADPATLAQFPQGLAFSVQATTHGAGLLRGDPIGQRFSALQSGAWRPLAPDSSIVLSATTNIAYLELLPVLSDDLLFNRQTNQLGIELSVVDTGTSVQCGDIQFAIRKPPVALIHGYNTTGEWGTDFQAVLGVTRPYNPAAASDNFIVTVTYGQDVLPGLGAKVGIPVYENTVASLDNCAQMALPAFNLAVRPLRYEWAFTRYDVVAHSQGGLLTRMLCNAAANFYIPQPFRNLDNFNRGRFHRVVTIGSPHNGTRLLRYLLDLSQSAGPLNLPTIVALLGVNSQVAQSKFDPWGPQIAELNDPSPSAPWRPDPGASFHLVRTVIDGGASPGPGDFTPSYVALGLTTPNGGTAVLPRGSDGVVDFDSMAANVPPASLGNNVFTLPFDVYVSHSGPMLAFNSSSFQTISFDVALHVIGALDQSLGLPPADIVFGSFSVPPLLSNDTKAAVDGYAGSIKIDASAKLVQSPVPLFAQTTYQYEIPVSTNFPPVGNVAWVVQVYGPSGITTDGVELSTSGAHHTQVTVTVDNALIGDVVLSATYMSGSNTLVVIPPTLVVSLPSSGPALTGFQMLPGTIALPVGSIVSPQFLATYSDGTSSFRFVSSNAVEVTSSQPAVVSVTNSLSWALSSLGAAQITATWSGFQATSQITVFDPASTNPPALSLVDAGNEQVTASWPGFTTSWQLQSSDDLSATNSWQPVTATPMMAGGESFVTLPVNNTQRFYRLWWQH